MGRQVRKVLIVDDELLARRMLKESIVWEDYGYTVCAEARNGQEGLEKVKWNNPDLIFVDIKMPLMDGLEMVKELNRKGFVGKIVMLSCYDDFSYVREAMRYGAIDYLLKHTFEEKDLSELLSRVEKSVRKEETRLESFNLLKGEVFEKILEGCMLKEEIREYIISGVLPVKDPRCVVISMRISRELNIPEKIKFETEFETCLIEINDKQKQIDFYCSKVKNLEMNAILIYQKEISSSDIKKQVKDVMTLFCKKMENEGICWLTGISNHIYCDWESLHEALKEAREGTRVDGQYLSLSAKVISALEFIQNNYSKQISLEDIAEYAGISRVYLSQIFKKETGKNIRDYLVEYRLSKARELLLTSNLKIYTISELCGFGSAQYFNKIFKKINGFSPYKLRNNNKE